MLGGYIVIELDSGAGLLSVRVGRRSGQNRVKHCAALSARHRV